jgi:hypothetical protein
MLTKTLGVDLVKLNSNLLNKRHLLRLSDVKAIPGLSSLWRGRRAPLEAALNVLALRNDERQTDIGGLVLGIFDLLGLNHVEVVALQVLHLQFYHVDSLAQSLELDRVPVHEGGQSLVALAQAKRVKSEC